MRPLTTVMMPAYEAQATIREAVESALGQTEERLEVCVVDDASRTPVREVLGDIRDPRLRILRHEQNRGTPAARNTAVAAARSPFVSQLDADDMWLPEYLETILPCFEDPALGMAYSNTHIIGHPTGHDDYIGDPAPHPIDTFPKLAEACPAPALTVTMRTEAVRGAGGYATWLWSTSDYHMYAKLAVAGWRFAYVHRQLARYRWPTPERGKSFDQRRVELSELKQWLVFVARHPLTPGPRRQVRVRLRREAERALRSIRAR
ncbi:MAG: glycosyltransferase family 2 protein [Actinomycetota bacterium]|nr:glycosyltransferase family 2 protein [Actinomycetota bacterium]